MLKKLLLFTFLLSILGFAPAKAQDFAYEKIIYDWTGNENLGDWQNLKIENENLKNFENGMQVAIYFSDINDGEHKFVVKDVDCQYDIQAFETASSSSPVIYTPDASLASNIKSVRRFYITGKNVNISRVVFFEAPEDPDMKTYQILDANNFSTGDWADGYKVTFSGDFQIGDVFYINVSGNSPYQLQVQYIDSKGEETGEFLTNGEWNKVDVYENNYSYPVYITDQNYDKLKNGGLRIAGKWLTFNSIDYKGKAENVSASEFGADPDAPTTRVILDNINFYSGDNYQNDYKVKFTGDFQIGDYFYLNVSGSQTYQLQVCYIDQDGKSGEYLTKGEYNMIEKSAGSYSYAIEVTAENIEILKSGGIRVKGKYLYLNSVSYKGKSDDVSASEFGTDPDTPAEPLATCDLLPRLRNISLIESGWTEVTVTEPAADGSRIFYSKEGQWHGAGVMALSLEAIADANGTLDAAHYNGVGKYTDENGNEVDEIVAYPDDPFLEFNRWGKLSIELAEAPAGNNGLEVAIYYRDLDFEAFADENIKTEHPSKKTMAAGTTWAEFDLTDFRFIRAIALKNPAGGDLTVKQLYLTERKNFNDKAWNELWLPSMSTGEDNEGNVFDGYHLGYKSYKGAQKDGDSYMWDAGNGREKEDQAWYNALEIPASLFSPQNEGDPEVLDPEARYHYFAIVYKNATNENGQNSDWTAPGQFQLYINFPCYRTEKMSPQEISYWQERSSRDFEDKADNHYVDPLNVNYKELYTPIVAKEHMFRTLKVPATGGENESFYIEVPKNNHVGFGYDDPSKDESTHYSFGEMYIDDTDRVTPAPVYGDDNGRSEVRRRAYTLDDDGKANVVDLIKEHGLAIRGQNVSIVKLVYGGNVQDIDPDWEEPEYVGGFVSGIQNVTESPSAPALVNVYNLQGIAVRRSVSAESALEGIAPGIYIVNGKKVLVK